MWGLGEEALWRKMHIIQKAPTADMRTITMDNVFGHVPKPQKGL